jgi:hypothetical protein
MHGRGCGRAVRFVTALAVAGVALLAAGCSSPSTSGAPTTSTTAHPATPTTVPPAGSWSARIAVAPGTELTTVSCPAAGTCYAGSSGGQTYRLLFDKVTPLGPAVPSPSPQGTSYLSCPLANFCAAAPSLNQVATYDGSSWQAPATIEAAQGFTAIDCTGPGFCITIDGEGNSFENTGSGWSGNLGAWGAANQISCVSPTFCVAAEGGPSVWNGSTWTQPNDADAQGQLNAVSCASASFCALVDSSGAVLTWNGLGFTPPQTIATEPPLDGTNASGLTGVSCPTPTFCRAVDSLGRVFGWNGSAWSSGTLIDNGRALTAISCPTTTYCVAVDRSGYAFIST